MISAHIKISTFDCFQIFTVALWYNNVHIHSPIRAPQLVGDTACRIYPCNAPLHPQLDPSKWQHEYNQNVECPCIDMTNTSENVSERPWIHSAPDPQEARGCVPPREETTSFRGCFDRANNISIESALDISASKPGVRPPVVLGCKDAGEQLPKQEVARYPTVIKEDKERAKDTLDGRGSSRQARQAARCELREQNNIRGSSRDRTADVDTTIGGDRVTPEDLRFPNETREIQPTTDKRVSEPPRKDSGSIVGNCESSIAALHTTGQIEINTEDTQRHPKSSECQLDTDRRYTEMGKTTALLQTPSAQTNTSALDDGNFHESLEAAIRQSDAKRAADKGAVRACRAPEKESVLQAPSAQATTSARNDEDFHGLLEAAMRKSDAERAADKEAVRAFRVLQSIAPLHEADLHPDPHKSNSTPKQQGSPVVSQTKPDLLHPGAIASSSARYRCNSGDKRHGIEPVLVGSAATDTEAVSTDESSTLDLRPVGEPTTSLGEGSWVRYVSPGGYPYLYNAVTGDSRWVVDGGEEGEACDTPEVASPGNICDLQEDVYNNPYRRVNVDDGVGVVNKSAGKAMDGAESVETCAVSQSSQGASGPDFRNSSGETALHLAAMQLSLQGLSLLLAGGANVNATDYQGRTPLHHACSSCHDGYSTDGDNGTRACIALLLSSGALEDARDTNGQTPLHVAAARNNTCAVKALVVAGVAETADAEGNLPLHLAAAKGHVATMELLVQGNQAESFAAATSSSSVVVALEDIHEEEASLRRTASGWKTCETADGHTYYQNDVTGESSWGPPHVTSDGGGQASGDASAHAEDVNGHDTNLSATAHQNGEAASSCADATYKELVGLSDSRRDLSAPCEKRAAPISNGEMKNLGMSASDWTGTGKRNGEPLPCQDYQLREEAGHERSMASGRDERKIWYTKVGSATQGTNRDSGEGGIGTMPSTDDDDRRHDQPGHEHLRRRSTGKGERRPRRSRRRSEGDRICRMIAWPQALSPEDYEQTVGGVVASGGERSGTPSRSDLSAALFAACTASRHDDAVAVLLLLQSCGEGTVDVTDEAGRTSLHHACRGDDVDMGRILWQAGANLEARDRQGNTPLVVAAATASLRCLRFLLEGGVDIDGCNDDGDMPLHLAVWHGNLSCVKALVEGGAQLSRRNRLGFTPREGNAGPMLNRGARLPKALRHTLEYLEHAEAHASTWTDQDNRLPGAITTTVTSFETPDGSHYTRSPVGMDHFVDRLDCGRISSRRPNHGTSGEATDTFSSQQWTSGVERGLEGQQRGEFQGGGGVNERGRGGDPYSGRNQRNQRDGGRWVLENGGRVEGDDTAYMVSPSSDSELHGSYIGDSPPSRSAHYFGQFENRRGIYNTKHPSTKVETSRRKNSKHVISGSAGGEALASSTLPAAPPGSSRLRRGITENTVQSTPPFGSLVDLGPSYGHAQREPTADTEASPRTGGVVWGAVRRAFGSFIGGGGGNYSREEDGPLSENALYTETESPQDHAKLRPPTDAELLARMTSMVLSESPGARSTSAGNTSTLAQPLGSPPSTLNATVKVPLSLTPMQPPPDVLAVMKGRPGGRRHQPRSGTPPADVAAALEKARARTEQGGGAHRGGGAGNGGGIAPGGAERAVEDSRKRYT